MSDSAQGNVPKPVRGPKGETGALAPEEAERFASSFVPSWQHEEAPSRPAELEALSPPSSDAGGRTLVDARAPVVQPPFVEPPPPDPSTQDELTASDVDVSSLASPSVATAPTTAELLAMEERLGGTNPFPDVVPAPKGATTLVSSQPAPPPPQAAPLVIPIVAPAEIPQAPPPQKLVSEDPFRVRNGGGAPAVAAPRYSPDDSVSLPIGKSNKAIVIGAVAVVVVIALVIGVRALASGPSETSAQTTAAPPPTATHESPIPPPPPPVEVAASTTPPAQPSAPPQADTVAAAAPSPAPAPRPPAASPPSQSHTTSPPHAAADSAPKRPPKSKSGGGGIVRDNPF